MITIPYWYKLDKMGLLQREGAIYQTAHETLDLL